MELTNEILAPYVGGQLEIQNHQERYLYRGEVAGAIVADGQLVVTFKWLAKAKVVPGGPGSQVIPVRGWVVEVNPRAYALSLWVCGISDIGDNRICINALYAGELSILFPPSGSKLDPSQVEGLVLSQS